MLLACGRLIALHRALAEAGVAPSGGEQVLQIDISAICITYRTVLRVRERSMPGALLQTCSEITYDTVPSDC